MANPEATLKHLKGIPPVRQENRPALEIRPFKVETKVSPYAEGSVLISIGNTRVLCTASLDGEVPRWLQGKSKGWVTAEYGMLPRSTHTRNSREAAKGKQSGRTVEIQRLIGRSLRASIDLAAIPEALITIDCDVIIADGGTRTASITGAWIALAHALDAHAKAKSIENIKIRRIAALSSGSVKGEILVDLCYEEDSSAEFDCNIIVTPKNEIVEIQGTAEGRSITFPELQKIFEATSSQLECLFQLQLDHTKELSNISII